MKLTYHKELAGNFGDDLNAWLWRDLLGENFFDNDDSTLFYGIGTVLWHGMPPGAKVIFGSGTGYRRPPVVDDSFKIYCVRGPRTARALGVDSDLAIADPAYLSSSSSRSFVREKAHDVSFIPHHLSMPMLDWGEVTAKADMNLIDPKGNYFDVIDDIARSRLVLAESLHGAILADALRIPWIVVGYSYRFLSFKWEDWAESMRLDLRVADVPMVFGADLTPIKKTTNYLRAKLAGVAGRPQWRKRPYHCASEREIDNFARRMKALPREVEPMLSADSVLEEKTQRLLQRLEDLKNDFS